MQRLGSDLSQLQEFKRGWPIVLAGTIGMVTASITLPFHLLGPTIKSLEKEFGWSRIEIVTGESFLTVGALLSAWIVGRLMDVYGPRIVALVSLPFAVVGMVAVTQVNASLWLFYGFYFLIGFLGGGCSGLPYTAAIGAWFKKGRGFALGLALTGSGIGGALAPFLAAWAVQLGDWRYGFLFAAGLMALGIPSILFLLKPSPDSEPATREPAHPSAANPAMTMKRMDVLRDKRFQIIMFVFGIIALLDSGVILQIAPLLIESGYSVTHAAAITSLIGVAIIVSRIATGWLVDHFSPQLVGCVIFMTTAIGCIGFHFRTDVLAPILTLSVGITVGLSVQLKSLMILKYFDLRHYGLVFGTFSSIYSAAALASPVAVGFLFHELHTAGLIVVGILYGVAAVVIGLSTRMRAFAHYDDPAHHEETRPRSSPGAALN